MAKIVQIEGVNKVIRNLRKQGSVRSAALVRGMVKAGLYLQRQSQLVVPVDTGNLKNTAFTRKEKGQSERNAKGQFLGNSTVIVGYTADYAIYVHENLNARHAPGKIAKYLERPAREHSRKLIQIIAEEAAKE